MFIRTSSSVQTLSLAAVGALVIFGATVSVGHAEAMKVTASLTGSAETPPNKSDGTGTLSGTYDPATMTLTYKVDYKGLTGPATMAHFHGPAPTGKAAGVEVAVKGPVESPISGEVKLTPEQAKNLTDGMTYFNVHTAANKGGEIRGQILVK